MKKIQSNHKTLAAGFLALALTAAPARALDFTWDGSDSGAWSTAANWAGGTAPGTGTPTQNDIIFYQSGAGNLDTFLGTSARAVRSVTFTADADSDVNIRMDDNGTAARNFNLNSNTGTNTITVDADATGNFRIWSPVAGGRITMTGNLTVNHNGSGLLTVEKINNTDGATVTKTGTGTLKIVPSSSYKYTGATTVDGGTLLVDSGASIDLQGSFPGGITVNAATLGGTGYIKGNVSISGSGKLAVGMDNSTAGTLTFENSNLTLADGAQLDYLLGTASDLVTGVNVLTLNTQEWSDFTFTAGTGFGPGTYVLINAASVSGSLGGTLSGTVGGFSGTLSVDLNNDLILTVAGDKPTVTINQAPGQYDPAGSSPVNFIAVFSEAVTGFATGDVSLSGTAGATTATVTEIAPNDGSTYNVAVSGMTGNGTVIATIAEDVVDGGNFASSSTDNTVTYDTSVNAITWDGSSSGDWSTAANWDTNTVPNSVTADAAFYESGAGNLATFLGSSGKTLRSLTFTEEADSDVTIRMDNNDTTGRSLVFESNTGTSTISVDSGATGNFTITTTTTGGRAQMNNNLVIDHNGSGTLTIRRIRENSGNNYRLTKTGGGTLVYGNTAAYYYDGPTIINGGTFRFAANDALFTGPISIGAATLDAATFTDSVGTLDVTGAATINLGTGAAIAFADSSGIDWTGGTLSLTGTFVPGTSLRFGTTASGLTATQLGLISAPGVTAFALDENGYLIEAVTGGFSAWQDTNSTAGGLNDDHDNDGVANGVEWFLGGNTNTTGFTALPGVTNTGGALSVTWTKASDYEGDYGDDFRVETSETLTGAWTTETIGVNVALSGNDVTYTFPAGPAKKFVRLVVTGP